MTDLHDVRDLEDLYGPMYRYSDHKRGDRITYRNYGHNETGTILWCVGPGPVSEGGTPLGMHYIVEPDIENWPATVFPGELVIDETPTPTRDIRRGDEVEFFGMHRVRLWGKALHDLLPGQEVIQCESINLPGVIVPIELSDVISVRRAEPDDGTITRFWE